MTAVIAGNWKMNGLRADGAALAKALAAKMPGASSAPCRMVLCPPATLIADVIAAVDGSGISVGGQDCHSEEKGAYTGNIAAVMLRDLGCGHVIVGHSERRRDFGETDAEVADKAAAAQAAGLVPIICVGETLEERDAGEAVAVVERQIGGAVPPAGGEVIVAYEPVWAIGTGRTPTMEDVAEIHAAARRTLSGLRGDGDQVPILYGGSAKAANAADLLAVPDVGGLLVGGASLDAEEFWAIANAAAA